MASLGVQARGAREAGMTAFPPQPVPGAPGLRPVFRILLPLLAMLSVAMRPAMAQSILRDAATEALFQDLLDPLPLAAGHHPGQVPLVRNGGLVGNGGVCRLDFGGSRIT